MGKNTFDAIQKRANDEPFAKKMGLCLVEISRGYSRVTMEFTPDMENIFGAAHGGAIFSLIDGAFEAASNSHGKIAVALNVSVTYHAPPSPGDILTAEALEMHRTNRTSSYEITVKNQEGELIASCQALAYRKKKSLPFLAEWTDD